MQQLIQRISLIDRVLLRLNESPSVALLGARQVGKTTLAQEIEKRFPKSKKFDLERPSSRAALESTPELVLSQAEGLVIIDEIQRMPSLFEILRPLCDRSDQKSTFLLLGSASPEIVKGVSESLAGRIQFVQVGGLNLLETGNSSLQLLWLRGGFPRSFLAETDEMAWRWMEGFQQTFLERDIPALDSKIAPQTLNRFWVMMAHYHGQTWNAAMIAQAMGRSPHLVNHYRDILAGTYMLRILQPWHENLSKRQVKSPKIYLRDSGLLHYLLGIPSEEALRRHPRYGASWEGFAIEQILSVHGDKEAYFWSTQRGAEVDLLLLRDGKRWGFEFKCSDAPTSSRSMHIAVEDLKLDHLWVVYPGAEKYCMTDKITAISLEEALLAISVSSTTKSKICKG